MLQICCHIVALRAGMSDTFLVTRLMSVASVLTFLEGCNGVRSDRKCHATFVYKLLWDS